jgi:hypothetical protein
MAVGIPLGLTLLALVAYILRRHRKRSATSSPIASPDVSSPPNDMAHSNSRVFDNVELEACPQSPFGLDSYSNPNELDGTPTTAPHPGNRISTPTTSYHPGNRISTPTTSYHPATHLSTISELEGSPGRLLKSNNRVSVMTMTEVNRFSAVSALDPDPLPRYLRRMYRPSGLLPVSGSSVHGEQVQDEN